MRVNRAAGGKMVAAAAFLQVIAILVSAFGAQWVNCNILAFDELSFGLMTINIDPPSRLFGKTEVDLRDDGMLNMVSDAYQGLVTSSNVIRGICVMGAFFGLVAAGTAASAANMPRSPLLEVAVFLLLIGCSLGLAAYMVFTFAVRSKIEDLGISDLITTALATAGVPKPMGFDTMIGHVSKCSENNQEMKAGSILTLMQALLVLPAGLVAAMVPSRLEQQDPRALQAGRWNPGQPHGGPRGGPPGGGYGGPPGGGYGGPPGGGYGGPPGGGCGAPPGGYGGWPSQPSVQMPEMQNRY